jgi:hypothetical protein
VICRYYLRRLLQSLVEQQKQAALANLPRCDLPPLPGSHQQSGLRQDQQQQQQSSAEEQVLSCSAQSAALDMLVAALSCVEDKQADGALAERITPIAAALASRSAEALMGTLLALQRRHPQLAARLLMRGLGPAGWELLSTAFERRQEELAAQLGGEHAEAAVSAVCDELYSGVDRQKLLQVILGAKRAFAQQALRAVLDAELAGCL